MAGTNGRHGDDLSAVGPVDGSIADHLYSKRMSDQFQELSVFVRAAETGSFSKTAREFRLSQPSVSRWSQVLRPGSASSCYCGLPDGSRRPMRAPCFLSARVAFSETLKRRRMPHVESTASTAYCAS